MKILNKLKSGSGFTMVELLATILILLMVSAVVAAGVPVASSAFVKAVDAANAQTLLSTTVNALRSELSGADRVEVSTDDSTGKTSITYYVYNVGSKSQITCEENAIMLLQYIQFNNDLSDTTDSLAQKRQLVTPQAATDHLYVVYDSVEETNDVVKFTGIKVYNRNTGNMVATTDLSIRIEGAS